MKKQLIVLLIAFAIAIGSAGVTVAQGEANGGSANGGTVTGGGSANGGSANGGTVNGIGGSANGGSANGGTVGGGTTPINPGDFGHWVKKCSWVWVPF